MAKSEAAAPETPKEEAKASISWPSPERTEGKKGVKLTGDLGGIALGKRCRVVVEGVVKGFTMDQWGGSLSLATKAVKVDHVSDADDEEMGEAMTDMVERMQAHKRKE